MKTALITGITGQDGSYLAEFLLEKGYEVHGITRRASLSNTGRIDHLMGKIKLHDGDLTDSTSLIRIIKETQPDEIYNLAAQSHVQVSFDVPEYSGDVDAIGVLRILEAVRMLGLEKKTKIYQASTSELYGKVEEIPQKETTPFHPYSPYAVAKQYGFWMVKEYREAYGMFAVNGILFNHESERRGENFVTRKITLAAGRIAEGLQDHLELGNMDSLRDWGYAKDYVECMWLIMQQEKPDDFVIATGVQHTVRDFTEKAFAANGMTIRWEGSGIDECYSLVDKALLLDLATPQMKKRFPDGMDVGFCCRPFDSEAVEEIRKRYDKPIVYVSVGGSNSGLDFDIDVRALPYQFISTAGLKFVGDNVTYLPTETDNTNDYIAAADYCITKAGWGTIGEEMIAGNKVALIERSDVFEDTRNIKCLAERGRAIPIRIDALRDIGSVLETMRGLKTQDPCTNNYKMIANNLTGSEAKQ